MVCDVGRGGGESDSVFCLSLPFSFFSPPSISLHSPVTELLKEAKLITGVDQCLTDRHVQSSFCC